ncbi:hypothetical protein N431DRAFT_347853 [Stipitochalara longipes BDJ]|nr:hypothetical protein N431DRAFT_347853 [Stipitochalara longipes BDJ]
MAVHKDLVGLEAKVCIEGQSLKEYHTSNREIIHTEHAVRRHHSQWTVTKYIEAKTNKEFTLKLSMKSPFFMNCPRLNLHIHVDGQPVYNFVWLRHLYDLNRGEEFVFKGPESTENNVAIRRPMKFTRIETTSDDMPSNQIEHDIARLSSVGEIIITVHRQELGQVLQNAPTHKFTASNPPTVVHETALKGEAKSHGTSFGLADPVFQKPYWAKAKWIDGADYPLVIFRFLYRSNETLKALMIIPRIPEPKIAPRNAYALLNDEQRKEVDVKDESLLKNQSSSANVAVKQEEEGEQKNIMLLKRRRTIKDENELIDLTGDSDEEPAKRPKAS